MHASKGEDEDRRQWEQAVESDILSPQAAMITPAAL
jgi:hypothetical protein